MKLRSKSSCTATWAMRAMQAMQNGGHSRPDETGVFFTAEDAPFNFFPMREYQDFSMSHQPFC